MNTEEVHALRQVIDMYANNEHHNWLETGRPVGHIAEAFSTLEKYRQARSPELDNESLARAKAASRPGDWTKDAAESLGGIVRDHPSRDEGEDSQGPSVVDHSSREIEVRWAKETIGLVANELSRAYTEIEITRDGHTIPGKLNSIAERLSEALQRLGVVNYGNLDREIPF